MKFVREMLHITLKFPEFEVVTLEALIWRNLIWGFYMNDIYIWCLILLEVEGTKFVREMLHITLKFPEFEIVTLKALIWRNLIWGLDMNDIYIWCIIWLEAEGTKFVREMLHSILKFPEFEVVTLEALIGGIWYEDLIWMIYIWCLIQ